MQNQHCEDEQYLDTCIRTCSEQQVAGCFKQCDNTMKQRNLIFYNCFFLYCVIQL